MFFSIDTKLKVPHVSSFSASSSLNATTVFNDKLSKHLFHRQNSRWRYVEETNQAKTFEITSSWLPKKNSM